MVFPEFGNRVKVLPSDETENKKLAGLCGIVYGETVPSYTGVEVVGVAKDDYAVNVFFEELNEDFWFSADLLEVVDEGVGTEITLDGADKKWVKDENENWVEKH